MALIIKGEMPKGCSECRDLRFNIPNCPLHKHTQGNWYRIGKHPDCPIIGEIPDEHGRLIDADKLKHELLEHGHPDTREWHYAEVDQFIDECPTVVVATT